MDYLSLRDLPPILFANDYPHLKDNYIQTSDETIEYNCISFVLDDYENIYSSWGEEGLWIDGLERTHTPGNYAEFFRIKGGFEICLNSDLEESIEKIAIFGEENEFLHVAIQIQDGKWKSKMGEFEDIQHNTLKAVSGKRCGFPLIYMARTRK